DRHALEDAGEDRDAVLLLALRGQKALPRLPPIEVSLYLLFRDREPRRTTVEHHAHAAAVRLAERGDPEEVAERIGHARLLVVRAEEDTVPADLEAVQHHGRLEAEELLRELIDVEQRLARVEAH